MARSKETGPDAGMPALTEPADAGVAPGPDAGYSLAFQMELAYGYCVGVRMPDLRQAQLLTQGADAEPTRNPLAVDWPIPTRGLTAEERACAENLRGYRRPDYIAGRLALRAALGHHGTGAATIGATERGAPIVPDGAVGSISHKRPFAIALAARADGWTLGVDLEDQAPTSTDITRRVLTESERATLARLYGDMTGLSYRLAVVRRFSIKEAIYKAIDPFVQRYVGFLEVSLEGAEQDGDVVVHTHLDPPPRRSLAIRARIVKYGDYFISSARARLA